MTTTRQRNRITLQPNVPLTGRLKFMDWFTGQHGTDLRVVVDVDAGQDMYPEGDGSFFVPGQLAQNFIAEGWAQEQEEEDRDGNPKWRVIGGRDSARLTFVKRTVPATDGGRPRTSTVISAADGSGRVTGPEHRPEADRSAEGNSGASGHTPEQAGDAPEQVRQDRVREWRVLGHEYAMCARMVAESLSRALDVPVQDLSHEAVQAGAATLMIRAGDRGLRGFVGMGHADDDASES